MKRVFLPLTTLRQYWPAEEPDLRERKREFEALIKAWNMESEVMKIEEETKEQGNYQDDDRAAVDAEGQIRGEGREACGLQCAGVGGIDHGGLSDRQGTRLSSSG